MNNEQFRRLLFDNSTPTASGKPAASALTRGEHGTTLKPAALGSRMRSSIPMTPRAVGNVNFARQLAEFRQGNQPPPAKKFKSSAPKGTKYTGSYLDRTQLRQQAGEEGDAAVDDGSRAKRVQALEEMVKLGQIDQATFEKLREEIGVGGDISSTHLVKGLDRKLLQRVKAGEDVVTPAAAGLGEDQDGSYVDDEFDRVLEDKEKEAIPETKREEKVKKGTMAPPPGKMTRDEILRQLKASRAAGKPISLAQEPPVSMLGEKFKKIGASDQKKRWIETDEHGRRKEILVVTDSEGKLKRKARWLDKPDGKQAGLLAVDKSVEPLGMEVPLEIMARANVAEEEEDDDIFEGVGDYHNPLADVDDGSSSSESEKDVETEQPTDHKVVSGTEEMEKPAQAPGPRNYFSTTATTEPTETKPGNPLSSDPTILAALRRAAAIRQRSPSSEGAGEREEGDEEATLRRKKFLEEAKRREREDAMDLDLGFGQSRFGDDDEEEELWDERGGGNKRKRGPKKRKGNKDSAGDVMRVLEGRKKAGNKT
ncbi:predicted protein [Uncinocarpus reesii 1704]|uniref:RED-like N-terminal domain-containing protein n=1 Tax=Uncinocarpus reesii (strain UAMH 1704) TaxID=336963 RepID=C4JFX4_UNCRE|nr:uncharacterized protein UREG_01054 [Uncinocarpus reesii 1704]EEP76205.1 predicted protein [Uncinocarpus reesii 1704]